jgi:hypothetical protein
LYFGRKKTAGAGSKLIFTYKFSLLENLNLSIMQKRINSLLFIFSCLVILICSCRSSKPLAAVANGSAKQAEDYAKEPYWIKMMYDPKVNYYEAIKAYDVFWAAHGGEPIDAEEEQFERAGEGGIKKRNTTKRDVDKKGEENDAYSDDIKAFKHWRAYNEPLVQPNGTILTPEQLNELRKIKQ